MKEIIPALLSSDIQEIKDNLAKLEGLVDWAQIDIMDNKFVPNISIAVKDLIGVKTKLKLEAHLMIFNPQDVFKDCKDARIKRVFFHFEAVDDAESVLKQMEKFDFERGIAINPETEINKIEPYLDKIDLILFLSVNPGFQGRGFIESVLEKVKELRKMRPEMKIEIDGGINIENIKKVSDAGVDYVVAGSAVLKGGDIEGNLKELLSRVGHPCGCPTRDSHFLDNLCVNTIRMLSADMIEKAKSGHPGMPMGAAAMAYVLWTKFLKHNPKNPDWLNRDRFVLSAGHGSALLYSLLHLSGYNVSMDDIKNFRQWGSKTAGHPEYGLTPGVEMTTGPLGQGFATGIGMALAERLLANRYNSPSESLTKGTLAPTAADKLIDYYIYSIVSDGDLMEGVASEAASYAGSLRLGKIIYLYDSNNISIEGSTDLTFTENVEQRFNAYHWQVLNVYDGNNLQEIEDAIKKAQEDPRPSLIITKTHIGFGSPNKADTANVHGSPLGEEELKNTKKNLGWPDELFYVPKEVGEYFKEGMKQGEEEESKWNKKFEQYKKSCPKLAEEITDFYSEKLPDGWEKNIPKFDASEKGIATRTASHKVINSVAPDLPQLLGGSADLGPSNNTKLEGMGDVAANNLNDAEARNLHFGVREHAMGAILNGLALSKLLIPYGGTFLIFSNYMLPAIRLAALMKLRVVYVFTHDSIGLGEDGPTHQPIEQLISLRAIPNLTVIRPADANETAFAWKAAIENKKGPTALILSRQNLPIIDQKVYNNSNNLKYGAYILNKSKNKKPDIILIATGSEVHLALEAAEKLGKRNISARVVSMPSWELFEKQSQKYKDKILSPKIKARLSIEAGSSLGWYKYVGDCGKIISIDRFGASAPAEVLFKKFGFTAENVVKEALKLFGTNKNLPLYNDPEIACLVSKTEKAANKKFSDKILPSIKDQLADI